MAVTRAQYPAEEDMARFLGIFTGSMMIFTLLVKLLVFSYLIRNYGLKVCLAVSPILLALFTVVAILVGMSMGYTPEASGGFLIFFLLLALGRLFSKSLKDSIESPSFKVIYQTIDEKIRFEIQSGMDGTVNEIAALSSGLILAGMGVLSFIKLIHFSWVLLAFILIWIFVAVRLYTEYRKSIHRALESGKSLLLQPVTAFNADHAGRFASENAFRKDYFSLVTGDYSSLEATGNRWYLRKIINHSSAGQDTSMLPVLKKLQNLSSADDDTRRITADTARKLEELTGEGKYDNDKVLAARKMLTGTRMPQTTELLRLLRDNNAEAKRLGMFLIGKFRLADLLPEVCDCLNIKGLETDAYSVLKSFGNDAAVELERFYLASSGNINTSRSVLRLLGRIHTDSSRAFLFSRLWSNSRQLKELAVKCLPEIEFKPSEEEKDKLHQLISETIGIMTWNLAARRSLERENNTILKEVVSAELERWRNYLFDLLAVTYDRGSIVKIKENLDSETVESVNFALEMIDIVIDDAIKQKLIMLVDSLPDEEKLKNLYQFYPVEIPSYERIIEDLINRDYNLVSVWTKACVLRSIKELESESLTESVAALLFSPEEILLEESARIIASSGMELYRSVSRRLSDASASRLDKIVTGKVSREELLYEKTGFLAACFPAVPEDELLSVAPELKFFRNTKELGDAALNNSLIWRLTPEGGPSVKIHYEGSYSGSGTGISDSGDTAYYALSLAVAEDFEYKYPESSVHVYDYINTNEA